MRTLQSRHPIDYAMLGSCEADAFVGMALDGAARHGFDRDHDIDRYLELMVILGAGFDADPQLAWASRALSGSSRPAMSELWKLASTYVQSDAGQDGGYYRRALLRAKRLPQLMLTKVVWTKPQEAESMLRDVHPEKLRLMQTELTPLFACAQTLSSRHERGERGVRPLYLLLMFLLGSHFEVDPRYAWATEILSDSGSAGPAKYEALHAASLKMLDTAFAWMRLDDRSDV